MLDTLWAIFLGSLLVLGIVLLWHITLALIILAVKQWKRDRHA